jgi:hypothetical protein
MSHAQTARASSIYLPYNCSKAAIFPFLRPDECQPAVEHPAPAVDFPHPCHRCYCRLGQVGVRGFVGSGSFLHLPPAPSPIHHKRLMLDLVCQNHFWSDLEPCPREVPSSEVGWTCGWETGGPTIMT